MSRKLNTTGLRKVRWAFDASDDEFTGYTDDTTWNGFLNVWVTPATHAKAIAALLVDGEGAADPDTLAEMRAMTPDLRGLISYAYGYTTQEIEG